LQRGTQSKSCAAMEEHGCDGPIGGIAMM